jgi:hypothetical protein
MRRPPNPFCFLVLPGSNLAVTNGTYRKLRENVTFSSNARHKAVIEKLASRGSYATVCVSLILRMPPAASPGVYGRQGIPASGNTPSSRQNSLGWNDSSGNLWLIGGGGMDSTGQAGMLNDVWKFCNGQRAWVTGSKLVNQNGVYGTRGRLAPGNSPGARFVAAR